MNMRSMNVQGQYIVDAANEYFMGGDAYLSQTELYNVCKRQIKTLQYDQFCRDLRTVFTRGELAREGARIYIAATLRYEDKAAAELAQTMSQWSEHHESLHEVTVVDGRVLSDDQYNAVQVALHSKISLILGGAGTGKSTLIRALIDAAGFGPLDIVLCAPTGKAARRMSDCCVYEARTVHSALGLRPNEDFLGPVQWAGIKMVVVDECSLMSLEMLAGILNRANDDCHIVLVGDPQQLQSVGTGNVINDLLSLGIPRARLDKNHRLYSNALALTNNVLTFKTLAAYKDLAFDDSFVLNRMKDPALSDKIAEDAAHLYLAGASVQVLSPYNAVVKDLNDRIQCLVNPARTDKATIETRKYILRDGDRVLITQNDRYHQCSNGDVGKLEICRGIGKPLQLRVQFNERRRAIWFGDDAVEALNNMALGYAITVHRAQGSEYDNVLMAISMSNASMLTRQLFYTAISRAKQRVVLYGDEMAVDLAMHRSAKRRNSMLVTKTHQQMLQAQ